jgi:hypothetical protein
MFVFAIETCGKTVAFTKETDRYMLDGILNGEREEGKRLRDRLLFLRAFTGQWGWDGVSPFTARLATISEESDYDLVHQDPESVEEVSDRSILFDGSVFVPHRFYPQYDELTYDQLPQQQ